jgi:hypothetical protein
MSLGRDPLSADHLEPFVQQPAHCVGARGTRSSAIVAQKRDEPVAA